MKYFISNLKYIVIYRMNTINGGGILRRYGEHIGKNIGAILIIIGIILLIILTYRYIKKRNKPDDSDL